MSATAIWTVHCEGCLRWDDQWDTKAEANQRARDAGWYVGRAGGANFCPDCRKKRGM